MRYCVKKYDTADIWLMETRHVDIKGECSLWPETGAYIWCRIREYHIPENREEFFLKSEIAADNVDLEKRSVKLHRIWFEG